MDRGAWWATVHGVTESNMSETTECSMAQGITFKVRCVNIVKLFLLQEIFLLKHLAFCNLL